jgi:pimeloyl-ACP methyl ester carboxylesterase
MVLEESQTPGGSHRFGDHDEARWSVVALHGVFSHGAWFRELGEALARDRIATLALDRRGCGASAKEGEGDARAWIEDVRVALETAGPPERPRVLLGWCWGARVALAALGAGVKADRLVLVGPGLAMSESVRARAAEAVQTSSETIALPFDVADFTDDPEICARIEADPVRWRSQPRAFVEASRAVTVEALRVLPGLELPMLTILATKDRLIDNDAVARLAAKGDLCRIPGGHALILERPVEVARAIVQWLEHV